MRGWLSSAAFSSSSWHFRHVLFSAFSAAAAPANADAAWQVSQDISNWWCASVVFPMSSMRRSPPTTIAVAMYTAPTSVAATTQRMTFDDTRRSSQYR